MTSIQYTRKLVMLVPTDTVGRVVREMVHMLFLFARGVLACLLVAMSLSRLAWAQPNEAAADATIELSEAMSRTLARNPTLAVLGFEIPIAEARLLQARFRPSPQLGVRVEDLLGTDDFRGGRSAETTVTLGWVLERGTRAFIVDAARARIDVSVAEIEIARLDAAAATAHRFIDCLAYQERHRSAERGVELARDAVAAVRLRVEASRAPVSEIARAEAELARAELRLDDYTHELLSAYHLLSAQWGERQPDFGAVAGALAAAPVVAELATLLARVEENPDLALFFSLARVAEAELTLARARSRPSWELTGGLRRMEGTDDWALVGGITIPLRLGNRNQGRIEETRADIARIEAESFAERVRIETQLFVLYQELVHNMELAAGLESEVAPRLERALVDTQRAFELGRSSYLELGAAQSTLLEVSYEIIDAQANALRLAVEIERLTGVPVGPASETQ